VSAFKPEACFGHLLPRCSRASIRPNREQA